MNTAAAIRTLPRSLGLARLRSVWGVIGAIVLLVAGLAPEQLPRILTIVVGALASTAPYIAVAVLLIAGLKATGAEALVAKAFEGREVRMIFLAALLGGLRPFAPARSSPLSPGCWRWARPCRR